MANGYSQPDPRQVGLAWAKTDKHGRKFLSLQIGEQRLIAFVFDKAVKLSVPKGYPEKKPALVIKSHLAPKS